MLNASDLATREVDVPEWKSTVTIAELALDEGLKLVEMYGDGDKVTLTGRDIAQVVAWSVVDPETGERLFTDDDVPKLARKSRSALMRLFTAVSELSMSSGFEEAEKN